MNVTVQETGVPGGTSERRGAPCGVPGLAVTEGSAPDRWVVTHLRSGCAVAIGFASPEAALAAARAVAGLADWTLPGTELTGGPELRLKVYDAVCGLGGRFGMNAGDAADLAGERS